MKSLTVFVLPVAEGVVNVNDEKFQAMFGEHEITVRWLSQRDLTEIDVDTDWFMYLFEDEKIDQQLMESIPVCMESLNKDIWIMMKKDHVGGEARVFQSARLIRTGQKMKGILPDNFDIAKADRILNGWVLNEND